MNPQPIQPATDPGISTFIQHCPQSKAHNFSCVGFSDPAELPISGVVVDDVSPVPGALEIGPVFSSLELLPEGTDSIEVIEFHLPNFITTGCFGGR